MQRDTKVQLFAAGVLALCLTASGMLATRVSASIGRNKLSYTVRTEDGQPPQVALGIAMGAFRGIFVNFLWMRANDLKEAGRYHESVELARAITELQPRFPRAWTFHAWNLAYNISVTTQTREERWRWVNEGISLLREKGIRANPNDLQIHKELAWIYLHKVQGVTDDANIYYKKKVAEEWHIILGAPPRYDPSIREPEKAAARFIEWLTPIAEAPDSLGAVVERVPAVRELADRLADQAGLKLDFDLLREHAIHAAVNASGQRAFLEGKMTGPRTQAFRAIFNDSALAEAWAALLPHVRKRVIVDRFKMDPYQMVRFTRKYGPMDWRNPAAHAVYWAATGVENALGRVGEQNKRDFDFVNTDRVVIQAIQELYRTGTIFFDFLPFTKGQGDAFYLATVEPNFVDTYGNIIDELVARSGVDGADRVFSFYTHGYENFLMDVIRYFYRRGDLDLANKYYKRLATNPGMNLNDAYRDLKFAKPLDEFVRDELFDRQSSPNVAVSEIDGAITGAFLSLLQGDTERFDQQMQYAKDFHRYYFSKQGRYTPVNPDDRRTDVMDPDFPRLVGGYFALFVTSLPVDDAEYLYKLAPPDLQRWGYIVLEPMHRDGLAQLKAEGGRDLSEVFPEPPGMAEFRAKLDAERRATQGPQIETK